MQTQSSTKQPSQQTHVATEAIIPRLLHNRTLWPGEVHTANYHTQSLHQYTERPSQLPSIPFHLPEIDSFLPYGGLQHDTIHEILYNDPLQPKAVAHLLPSVLAHNAHAQWLTTIKNSTWNSFTHPIPVCAPIVWIGKRCWPTPSILEGLTATTTSRHPTLLQHSLFIDPPNDTATLWAIETALRSPAIKLVIATCPRISRTTTQRLSLAARTHSSTAILLRAGVDNSLPSCATSRWIVAPIPSENHTPSWELTLAKLKGSGAPNVSWTLGIQEDCFSTSDTYKQRIHPLFASRRSFKVDDQPSQPELARAFSS